MTNNHTTTKPKNVRSRRRSANLLPIALVGVVSLNVTPCALAQEPTQLNAVMVVGDKSAVPTNAPSTTEAFTAKQIGESVNSVSSAGALLYLPSIHVRERFIGDVNGGLAMRMYGVNSSAETLVYADGLLLSNALVNSCCPGPRWGLVPQDSIDRVDVMYGPFSALYPGNSVGGVVLMTTHMPKKLEASAKVDVFTENFKLYGTDKSFAGQHGSASVGNRVGDWSFRVSADRLDNNSHPTDFTSARAKTGAAAAAGTYTDVTGAHFDNDIANNARVITAGTSMDHTVKDDVTVKVAYDFSPTLRATYTYNLWQNTSDKLVDSYLRDAAGNTIYGTNSATNPYKYVRINGQDYTVTAPSVSSAQSEHALHGLALKSSTGTTWDWEINASTFNQGKDATRASSGNFGTTASTDATAGTITLADGTGWNTLDVRGEWRPGGDKKSVHQLSFGYHTDTYQTRSDKYQLAAGNWRTSSAGALDSNSRGETATEAVYLQDAWQLAPQVNLVLGGRQELWKASKGSNVVSGTNYAYADKSVSAFSPKAALSYLPSDEWALRGSYGRGVRFPTVGELFKNFGITPVGSSTALTSAQIIAAGFPAPYNAGFTNDPNLKPETADSFELTVERLLQNGVWRTSLFGEEKQDALVSQSDITTLPGYSVSSVQNVDKVRTYGVETVLQLNDALVRGLDLSGSVTYIHARIAENRANPGLVGTELPLIPVWRASLLGVYRASSALSYSLGWRYSGQQHSGLANPATGQYPDPNPNVYGGRSSFSVFDAKVRYQFAKQWSASVGVDNITDATYFTLYPYAQRTFFASLKVDY